MKKYYRSIIVSFAVVAFAGAALCLVTAIGYSPLHHTQIGKHDLYIPQPYMRDASFSVKGASIFEGFITTFYPGDIPLPAGGPGPYGKPSIKRIEIYFKDLDQIAEPYRHTALPNLLNDRLELSKAYQNDGEQYGLIHQEQSENPNKIHKIHDEFWIERKDGVLVSYIECDGEGDVRHCNHYFRDGDFSYKIFFDKTYLPQWSAIRTNVIALMNSFRSEETALTFMKKQNLKTKNDGDDGKP